ncbi:MAG: glycosyltransferase family 4 protein [Aggregatilineales bacterium]
MRILLVMLQARLIGGLETYCRDAALALRELGHSVEGVSALESSQRFVGWEDVPIQGLAPANHALFRLYMRAWRIRLTLELRKRRGRYDWILIMHPYAAICAYRAHIRNYFVWSHGIDVWGEWSVPFTRGMENACHLVTVSQYTCAILHQQLPNRDISIIYPMVDTTRFVRGPAARTGPPHVLLTVGRLVKAEAYKGHESVIRNLTAVQQRVGAAVEYWIAGEGDDRSRLEQIARNYSVSDSVKFLGRVSDQQLVSLYQACDIFVMPSAGEGFGIVYLEANACEKPVIGSIIGGTADAVEHGVTGLCIDPHSDNMLVNAIAQLILDTGYAHQLGLAGRARVQRSFSRESLIYSLEKLLEKHACVE